MNRAERDSLPQGSNEKGGISPKPTSLAKLIVDGFMNFEPTPESAVAVREDAARELANTLAQLPPHERPPWLAQPPE